jgi:3-hydroxymyristoyl/3-hydroxydecanoyl-(acyl carrier protein) dehydratase
MNEKLVSEFVIPAQHPALTGHFPGRPVVPGVVLLDAARAAVTAGNRWTLHSIPAAKFLHPVQPGDRIDLVVELLAEVPARVRARFRGSRGTEVVFEGSFLFATSGDAA